MIITMKPLREILASNIDRIIKESGLTARDIASKMEVSETTVHRWKAEKHPIPPDVENMDALAKLLGVDPAEFYKSPDNVVPIYGNAPLRKFMIIPDDIIEGLSHFKHDSTVWSKIRVAIETTKRNHGGNESKNHA